MSGEVLLADLDVLIDALRQRSEPAYTLYVLPQIMRRGHHFERIWHLECVHPLPRYKIRACKLRKIHQARRRGRAHIRGVERAERQWEEATQHGS